MSSCKRTQLPSGHEGQLSRIECLAMPKLGVGRKCDMGALPRTISKTLLQLVHCDSIPKLLYFMTRIRILDFMLLCHCQTVQGDLHDVRTWSQSSHCWISGESESCSEVSAQAEEDERHRKHTPTDMTAGLISVDVCKGKLLPASTSARAGNDHPSFTLFASFSPRSLCQR